MCIVCVLTWSLLGVKKSLGCAQIGLFQGFNLKFPTSIPTPSKCGVPPPGTVSAYYITIFSLNVIKVTLNVY